MRVLFNGRRWWYQPQAIVTERSGLIETPGVWFLRSILRTHAYDHLTLTPLDHVSKATAVIGDWVMPKGGSKNSNLGAVGRIVNETASSSPARSSNRDAGSTVVLEFLDKGFAEACGLKLTGSDATSSGLVTRRVRTSKLVPCNPAILEGPSVAASVLAEKSSNASTAHLNDRLATEMKALSRLDGSIVDSITKECERSSEAMANFFSGGLPSAILTSIDVAERQMGSLEPRDDLSEKIASIGRLSRIVAKQLFYVEPVSGGPECSADATRREPIDEPAVANAEQMPATDSRSDADDLLGVERRAGTRASAPSGIRPPPRRIRVRDIISRRDLSRRIAGDDPSANQQVAALQQRRNMIMSLMSRSRRGTSTFLNDLIDREGAVFGDLPPVPPIQGASHDSASAHVHNPLNGNWEESGIDALPPSDDQPQSYFDSVLRCRSGTEIPGSHPGSTQASLARNLALTGFLVDDVSWLKAIVESHVKKTQLTSSQRSSTLLKGLTDEEGTPLLLLAVSLGCNTDILHFLISRGSTVGDDEISMAAQTNQVDALAIFLRHSSFRPGSGSKSYSDQVMRVFAEAKDRQEQLEQKMRDEAGIFMVQLLRRLLRFGLKARRRRSPRVELCSQSLADIFVGNVLLRSLQATQKSGPAVDGARVRADEAARVLQGGTEDDSTEYNLVTDGLLSLLPQPIVREALLSDAQHVISFMAWTEDFLCSKDMNDAAAGLALLSTLLSTFPELIQSGLIQRYGVPDLLSFHDELATGRIADINSRQATLPVQPNTSDNASHAVFCPSKHKAVLFITRHSSFRCDICTNGVDRGRPMHGCRACDWDACEVCTDKAQSGIVKCGAIKDLVVSIRRQLSEVQAVIVSSAPALTENLTKHDCTQQLHHLTIRLLNRDVKALREIGAMLLTPGKVCIRQFTTIVVPALHAAFTYQADEDAVMIQAESAAGPRYKKARVVDGFEELSLESPEDKLKFCQRSVLLLAAGSEKSASSKPGMDCLTLNSERDEDSDESPDEDAIDNAQPQGSQDFTFSESFQELLRRLHQVLALHERVGLVSSRPEEGRSGASSEQKGGDLHTLTKPLDLRLSPVKFSCAERASNPARVAVLQVEPLLPMEEVTLHILRANPPNNAVYLEFCHL